MAYLVYFGLPIFLLLIGFPVFLILLVTSIVAVLTIGAAPPEALQTYMFGGLDSFPLMAVPFFILAGEFMAQGGVARRVIAMTMAIFGGVRGSLAVTTVAASELFGAMSHTAIGTVVAMGRMIYPSLKDAGYNERFAVGLIASSGAIAVIIPPSIAMILYAVAAEQSAVQLFIAGILPSLLIGVIDAGFVMIYARRKRVPLGERAHWKLVWKTTKEASWALGTLAVIFGGIYGGAFTPTEAAGVAVVYSIFVTMVIYREVDIRPLLENSGRFRVPDFADSADRDLCEYLFVAADDQRHSPAHRCHDQCTAPAKMAAVAEPECRPPRGRKFSGTSGRDPHSDSVAAANCAGRRRRCHSVRHYCDG